MKAREELAARVEDLERRIAALKARPDASVRGQRFNIMDLESELTEARDALLAWRGPNPDAVWSAQPRDVGGARTPLIEVVRGPQVVRRIRGRARVVDAYDLVVGGRVVAWGSLRGMMQQAHLTVAYGVGKMPPYLAELLKGRPGLGRRMARFRDRNPGPSRFSCRERKRLARRLAERLISRRSLRGHRDVLRALARWPGRRWRSDAEEARRRERERWMTRLVDDVFARVSR